MATPSRTFIKVSVNGTESDYPVATGTYASSLVENAQFREDFGLPRNFRVLVNGSSADSRLKKGDVVRIETVASSKAATAVPTVRIKVRANGETTNAFVPRNSTAGSLVNNAQFREDFGLPRNFRVLLNGVQNDSQRLAVDDVISIETVASSKAA